MAALVAAGPAAVQEEVRGHQLGADQLAIVRAPLAGRLTQLGDALWLEGSGGDLEPARGAAVRQGSLERSNVDSLSELVQMITVQRGFQATARALTSLGRIKSAFVNATNR